MTAKIKKTGRYKEGMRKRQQCLDYIIANPGALSPDISEFMKEDRTTTTERLRLMAENGDVSRKLMDRKYTNAAGKTCNVSAYAHTALRTVSEPPEEWRAKTERNNPGTHRAQALNAMKTVEPWLTRNVDPDRKAKRNPDAQHSGMPRVFVGSMG